jgi:hypothetical protein
MISKFLGTHISEFLSTDPFSRWRFTRSVVLGTDRPCIDYESTVVDIVCDLDETIRTIFLYEAGANGISFFDVPFSCTQNEVRKLIGNPSKSGEGSSSPVLGASGAWDRFSRADHTIHVEYKVDTDEIRKITLMRNDIVRHE